MHTQCTAHIQHTARNTRTHSRPYAALTFATLSIGFLNELFSCLSDALLVAATVFTARNPNPNPNALDATVAAIVVPLYTDAYAIFSYVTYAFQQLYVATQR